MNLMAEHTKSPPDLALVRQQIERLTQELEIWKTAEQGLLAVKAGVAAMGLKDLFINMPAYDAICAFLKREGKPQRREIIIAALIEGGASLGKYKEKSINQSISTNIGLKKLKELNGLVGFGKKSQPGEWPDEKFNS